MIKIYTKKKVNKKEEKILPQVMLNQRPEERRHNFQEVPLGYSSEQARLEAMRCLQCKIPTCIAGCPVGVSIPEFIYFIAEGNFAKAIVKLWEKNFLPAICGRVCPQENQCQANCILNKCGEAIFIGNLERFVADWAYNRSDLRIPLEIPKIGKRVAIAGSGPSGLTIAGDLIRRGYEVTIYEAFHKPGGVLTYGIPEFRLPKEIVMNEISFLETLGVKINCNVVVGRSITIDELLSIEKFDVVYLGVGAGLPTFLKIPGENLIGIYSANEYLTRTNLMKAYLFPKYDTPILKGKRIVVFGGGNVAIDCSRTALRVGADIVQCVYRRSYNELPARIEEIHHAEEEGVKFIFLHSPLRFIGDEQGWLRSVELQEMELGEIDKSGRPIPIPKSGSIKKIDCDLAIIAVGSGANPIISITTPNLEVSKEGYIIVDNNGKTKKERVWAGGDIVTGAATVISAAGAGRKASISIHKYLTWGW